MATSVSKRQLAISAGICVLPIAALAIIFLGKKHDLAPVGADCTNDVFCSSLTCLHGGSGSDAVAANSPGVCTVSCTDDNGCPSTMRCGDVTRLPMFAGIGAQDEHREQQPMRCIPRAW